MGGYKDSWVTLNRLIEKKIGENAPNLKAYLAEVVSDPTAEQNADGERLGYYVSVKYARGGIGSQPLMKIPVIQSKYHSVITQPGDIGLLINAHQELGNLLEGKSPNKIAECNYFFFLPLMSKDDYQGSAESQILSSPDLQTFIKIADDGITMQSAGTMEVTYEADITLSTEANLTISTKENAAIEVEGDFALNGANIALNTDGDATIEAGGELTLKGADIAITGDNPLEIAGQASLKEVLEAIVDAIEQSILNAITTPAAPGSPCTINQAPMAAVQAAQVKQKISQLCK